MFVMETISLITKQSEKLYCLYFFYYLSIYHIYAGKYSIVGIIYMQGNILLLVFLLLSIYLSYICREIFYCLYFFYYLSIYHIYAGKYSIVCISSIIHLSIIYNTCTEILYCLYFFYYLSIYHIYAGKYAF